MLLGSAQIAAGLARQFDDEEMAIAAEKWRGPKSQEWHGENGSRPTVYYIHNQWPWKFKRTVRLFLFPFVLLNLMRAVRHSQAQQVMAIFPCEYYLFLSWIVARWAKVPLVSYFHNTYLENRKGVKKWFASWLQSLIFRDSKIVFVMSAGMQQFLAGKNPGVDFVPLVHTFEEQPQQLEIVSVPQRAMSVAYLGSLNESNRDAFSRINRVLKHFPDSTFTTYSGNKPEDFASIGISGENVTHTSVAFGEVVGALRCHDVLFFPHGFTGGLSPLEYNTIFPTRTIPYLLSGVPMVVHSPAGAYLTKWLQEHDCAEVVDVKNEQALVSAFQRLIDSPARCRNLSRNAQLAAQEFYAPNVASFFRKKLNQIG